MPQIPNSKFQIPNSTKKRGALLLELLIVISLLAGILSVGTQAVYVSLQSGKVSGERDIAVGLASEALEAVRGASEEKWQNIYDLTKNSSYHPVSSSGNKWTIAASSELISVNNANYTRSFIIQNVCRESASTRNITGITDTSGTLTTCTASTGIVDPSTQKVTVTVSWPYADPVIMNEYLLRWKNKVCNQTDWSGGAVPGGSAACNGGTTYDNVTNLGVPNTSLQIQ